MSDSIITPVLSTPALEHVGSAGSKDSPEKIRAASAQFEALLIGQVLKTMHESEGEGWLGTGEDQTASSAMGMADEYLARSMASSGGFGLARMVGKQLAQKSDPAAPPELSSQ